MRNGIWHTRQRYKIFKGSSLSPDRNLWYGMCPHCPAVKHGQSHQQIVDLMCLHGQDHSPLTTVNLSVMV